MPLRAEIVCVGTELLVGSILNTNARFLAGRLASSGIDTYRQTVVGDNVDRIVAALREAFERSDLVITSGGLGPTEDDVTAEAVSRFLDRPLRLDPGVRGNILRRLRSRGVALSASIDRQSRIPADCAVLTNLHGTAPGLFSRVRLRSGRTGFLLVLPGPPRELEPMFDRFGLPAVRRAAKLGNETLFMRSVRVFGMLEAHVADKVRDLLRMRPPVTVGIYAKPGEVELKIMVKSSSRAAAAKALGRVERKIRARLGTKVYGSDSETLASAVGDLLRRRKQTLCTAESCTGGLLASRVTDVEGSSIYFKGGVVPYTPRAKQRALGLDLSSFKGLDMVTPRVAEAMALAALDRFEADWALAVTGNLGKKNDRGSHEKNGAAWIALARKGARHAESRRFVFYGNRLENKARAAAQALDWLRLELLCRR